MFPCTCACRIEIDEDRSNKQKPRRGYRMRVGEEQQGASLMQQKVSRRAKARRPKTAAVRPQDAALFSADFKPLLDPSTNPPNMVDISEDRTRNKRLQAARAAWSAAERLLSLNAASGEITKAFEEAQEHFASVGQATPRTDEVRGIMRTSCCTRFT